LYKRIKTAADKLVDAASARTRVLWREKQSLPAENDEYSTAAIHSLENEATSLFSTLVQVVQKRLGVQDEADTDTTK